MKSENTVRESKLGRTSTHRPWLSNTENLGFQVGLKIDFCDQIQKNDSCERFCQNSADVLAAAMKGRSHRHPPSAPLEDWGDGQWTVDCSCGVTFDDGEEMVSCDECGVWVHTRCSRYVRGEASFACHNCKAAAKRSRMVVNAAANNFIHGTEETEVAQLLVELPTKTDRPPGIQLSGAPYRPPFRLWANVPREERVHVQGVPGGDPSLFRGLSSKIFSPELWKRTGYVPKKFNFKYKEFPCWEEEERDKASLGADALFSLSKETVQADSVKNLEMMLFPEGTRKKEGEKLLLGTRSFGCPKKERNKLKVLGSSKGRKDESAEEKESGRRKLGGDFDNPLTNIKDKDGCAPILESRKDGLCDDERFHIVESDVLDTKGASKRDDIFNPSCKILDVGMDNGSKPKHMLVFKSSRKRLSEDAIGSKILPETPPRSKLSLESSLKAEKPDRMDGKILCKLSTAASCNAEGAIISKGITNQEDAITLFPSFKEPKEENHDHAAVNCGSTDAVMKLNKMNTSIYCHDSQLDVPNITSASYHVSCSQTAKKTENHLRNDATDDRALESSHFPLLSCEKQGDKDDLTQNLLISDEPKSIKSEEQSPQVLLKDSDLTQSYLECLHNAGREPMLQELDCLGSLKRLKNSDESNNVSKTYCSLSKKLSGANLNHPSPVAQKIVAIGKEIPSSIALVGSKSSLCCNLNSTANTGASSPTGKSFHVIKQQKIKVTNSNAGTRCASVTAISAEDSELAVLPQLALVHPINTEFMGSKSLETGKTPISALKSSLNTKEQPSAPSCEAPVDNYTTAVVTTEATTSMIQTSSNQLIQTASGSFQKNDKTIQPSPQSASKFFSHSLIMQSTSSNVPTTLSDEELALLLHQELNSSPRVPRVPRMRQTSNTQFATTNNTNMLSKRSCTMGREQVSFFRRKNKEEASKEIFCHSRDPASENRRLGRNSSEVKADETAIISDGFAKRGKGSRRYDTVASSSFKTDVSSPSIEAINRCVPSAPDENGSGASLQTVQAITDGNATIAGRNLPCLIDEIMSKRKCSTYEELCDAVRPYWHGLRKPNGERYAYSSHSQAVLDCLRNRSEWAHLIDRGPKTNASKRRKKLDSTTMELEHEKSSSACREDFPKGKRNARKRRLLERRLGSMKEERKSPSQGTFSDEDPALSHSSNEENECHLSYVYGAGACSSSSGHSD